MIYHGFTSMIQQTETGSDEEPSLHTLFANHSHHPQSSRPPASSPMLPKLISLTEDQ